MCSDKINPANIIDMNFFGVTFGQMFSSCVFIVDATITIYISTPPFKKTVLMLPAYIKKLVVEFRDRPWWCCTTEPRYLKGHLVLIITGVRPKDSEQ